MTYQVRVFMKPVCTVLRLGKPEGEGNADGRGGSRHGRRGGAMTRLRRALAPQVRRAGYSLARMSGMLDLSKVENAKHFLPR